MSGELCNACETSRVPCMHTAVTIRWCAEALCMNRCPAAQPHTTRLHDAGLLLVKAQTVHSIANTCSCCCNSALPLSHCKHCPASRGAVQPCCCHLASTQQPPSHTGTKIRQPQHYTLGLEQGGSGLYQVPEAQHVLWPTATAPTPVGSTPVCQDANRPFATAVTAVRVNVPKVIKQVNSQQMLHVCCSCGKLATSPGCSRALTGRQLCQLSLPANIPHHS